MLRELNEWKFIVYYKLYQNMAESIFDVSRETLNAATIWINYVTSRNYFPVDGVTLLLSSEW